MIATIIEVTQKSHLNYGKFMVARYDKEEWSYRARIMDGQPGGKGRSVSLLASIGSHPDDVWVLDLQTNEGASFRPGGLAAADLDKHRVWVCPMFEPFLAWLYQQDLTDLNTLPAVVELPNQDAPAGWTGYRRRGVAVEERTDGKVKLAAPCIPLLDNLIWPSTLMLIALIVGLTFAYWVKHRYVDQPEDANHDEDHKAIGR